MLSRNAEACVSIYGIRASIRRKNGKSVWCVCSPVPTNTPRDTCSLLCPTPDDFTPHFGKSVGIKGLIIT